MRAFVLMPFATEFDEIYEHLIRSVLVAEGFSVSRADESRSSRNIMHDVIQGIFNADLVIADLSGANPNVYYELGLAHAFRKNVVLLAQDIDEVPFDLRAYRVVTYSIHFARIAEAQDQIRQLAQGARSGTVLFGSPVSDYGATETLPLPIEAELTVIDQSSHEAVEEIGPLDVAADLSEGMAGTSAVLGEFTERLNRLQPEVIDTTAQMTGPLRHNPRALRNRVRLLANQLEEFATWLKAANGSYNVNLQLMTGALNVLFTIGVTDRTEAVSQLPQVISVCGGVADAATSSREQIVSLADTLDGLPRVEKEFNRAKRRLSEELHSLVSNVDQTIAVMARTRAAGEQFLATESQTTPDSKNTGLM